MLRKLLLGLLLSGVTVGSLYVANAAEQEALGDGVESQGSQNNFSEMTIEEIVRRLNDQLDEEFGTEETGEKVIDLEELFEGGIDLKLQLEKLREQIENLNGLENAPRRLQRANRTQTMSTQIINGNRMTFSRSGDGKIRVEIEKMDEKTGDSDGEVFEADRWEDFVKNHLEIVNEYSLKEDGSTNMTTLPFKIESLEAEMPDDERAAEDISPEQPAVIDEDENSIVDDSFVIEPASSVITFQLGIATPAFVVKKIKEGSFASQLGLQEWDMVYEINGECLRKEIDIRKEIAALENSKNATVSILRKGQELTLTAAQRK